MPDETLEKIADFFVEHNSPMTASVIRVAINDLDQARFDIESWKQIANNRLAEVEVADQTILQLTERVRDLEQDAANHANFVRELRQTIEDLTTRDCFHCDHLIEVVSPKDGLTPQCTLLHKDCAYVNNSCGHFREDCSLGGTR